MAFLELVKGSTPGARFELDGVRAVIGRSADCEVPIDVPAVSRRHAAILRESGQYFVEDLQSRNGTYLNDKRVTDRLPLGEGDQLLICDQEFRFHTGHGTGILNPLRNLEESSIAELVDDTKEPGRASVMATLDVSGGSASWGI
jgi:pSer/pThr/pTyr-binding forkhead associated (FHA) protein